MGEGGALGGNLPVAAALLPAHPTGFVGRGLASFASLAAAAQGGVTVSFKAVSPSYCMAD